MIVNIILNGEEYTVSGDYQPAEGDGWNDPHYQESFDVYAVWDVFGREVPNWQECYNPVEWESSVLFELAYHKWQDESDDPWNE